MMGARPDPKAHFKKKLGVESGQIVLRRCSTDLRHVPTFFVKLDRVVDGIPITPITAVKPVHPITAVKPVHPITAVKPVHPITAVKPVHPITADKPVHPITADKPVHPITADKPVQEIKLVTATPKAVSDQFIVHSIK
jgi:hypothetical protein